MNIEITPISSEGHQTVYAFQCEYLDNESFDDFVNRVNANPDLYLAAFHAGELVGICYGQPSERDHSAINLQGIAVNLDTTKGYARIGIGSQLLKVFERAVKQRGYNKIGVGCADDVKVEHFYLNNGFAPSELVAKGPNHAELERVSINDYELGQVKQAELRRKHNPIEVIFIFEKLIEY